MTDSTINRNELVETFKRAWHQADDEGRAAVTENAWVQWATPDTPRNPYLGAKK